MFVEHWRILTCLLLRIRTLVPGWSSGTAVYYQEPVFSYWARQHEWCQPQPLHVNSKRWPSYFYIQPHRTNLQRIFCILNPRFLWIIFPVFVFWQLHCQAIKKYTKAENSSFKKGRLSCTSSIFWSNTGKIVKMDWVQEAGTVASCLPSADKLFYLLQEATPNPVSMDSETPWSFWNSMQKYMTICLFREMVHSILLNFRWASDPIKFKNHSTWDKRFYIQSIKYMIGRAFQNHVV